MGVKGFNREERNLTTTQIIEDTLVVEADGSVTFRVRRGKGSGRPIEIANDQFDKFVSLINNIASRRETLAEDARVEDAKGTTDVTTETTKSDETVFE